MTHFVGPSTRALCGRHGPGLKGNLPEPKRDEACTRCWMIVKHELFCDRCLKRMTPDLSKKRFVCPVHGLCSYPKSEGTS
jgi:hypothetical protein